MFLACLELTLELPSGRLFCLLYLPASYICTVCKRFSRDVTTYLVHILLTQFLYETLYILFARFLFAGDYFIFKMIILFNSYIMIDKKLLVNFFR